MEFQIKEKNIITIHRDIDKPLSKNFRSKEFICGCGKCTLNYVDQSVVDLLELARAKLGCPITVTSGFRCKDYQAELEEAGYETSKSVSSHQMGFAVDIVARGASNERLADVLEKMNVPSLGVGKRFCHVDVRGYFDGKRRRWSYRYS